MRRGLLLLIAIGLIGCDQSAPSPSATGEDDLNQPPKMRIVTLAPAISKMIVDLGMRDRIVGVTDYDDVVADAPSVGPFMDVNTETLYTLRPTHVLMMTGAGGVPESLSMLQASMGFKLHAWQYPTDVMAVGNILFDERELMPTATLSGDVRPSLGTVLGERNHAWTLKNRMLQKLSAIDRATDVGHRPLVLVVIGMEGGVMASGPGSVFDSLFRFVGALNAAADEENSAPVLDREKLLAARPDVILLMLPGAPTLGDFATDSRVAIFRGLDIPAVQNKRIAVINDPLAHLPATNLPQVAAVMARAIHPDQSAAIDAALAAEPEPVSHESP